MAQRRIGSNTGKALSTLTLTHTYSAVNFWTPESDLFTRVVSRPLWQVEDTGFGPPGFQVQQITERVCLQSQGSTSFCSGCFGESVGSVELDLQLSSFKTPSLPTPTLLLGSLALMA